MSYMKYVHRLNIHERDVLLTSRVIWPLHINFYEQVKAHDLAACIGRINSIDDSTDNRPFVSSSVLSDTGLHKIVLV